MILSIEMFGMYASDSDVVTAPLSRLYTLSCSCLLTSTGTGDTDIHGAITRR